MGFQKLDGKSADIPEEQKEKLKQLFPEAFAEDKVDFDKLKAALGEEIDLGERYGLSWKGKSNVFRAIQEPTTKTLKPVRDESVNFDETDNLFIEGDNLEVLKTLQRAYYSKIKMIYIDPPYNTGNDFVYNDKFAQTQEEYAQEAGLKDENGKITRTDGLRKNSKDGGHFHSNWLNMMYPRLYLARNLLRQDGVIFVSIDDNEVHNLRIIMNEIFGEENFVADFLWKKKSTTSNVEDAQVSSLVDHTLCFRRSEEARINPRVTLKDTRAYTYKDNEGNYRLTVIEKKDSGAYQRDTMKFEIIGHKPRDGKRWQIGKETADLLTAKNRFVYQDDKVKLKIYDFEDKDTESAQSNLLFEHGTTESAAKDIQQLFGMQELFDNPKPKELIKQLLKFVTKDGDIVLDFFSGSGTTAHAVMLLNALGSTTRRHIQVQLPEVTYQLKEGKKVALKDSKVAFGAGYNNIADIAKERIRRAGKKIQEEQADKLMLGNGKLDLGFKVLKLDNSNFKVWNTDIAEPEELKKQAQLHLNPIVDDATEEDLLFEIMIKSGIEPTAKRQKVDEYWNINNGELIICLAKSVSQELFQKMVNQQPKKVIILDKSLETDQSKINLTLQAEAGKVEVAVV